MMAKITWLRHLRRLPLYAAVLVVCGLVLFPIYWMVLTSLRPTKYTMTYPPAFWPEEVRWSAYLDLFQTIPIATWLRNTLLVSLGTTVVCLTLSILGAYALSSFRWRGRTVFGFALLGTQMLPEALLLVLALAGWAIGIQYMILGVETETAALGGVW
jgi:multiple sugar transport system permease protein